MEDIDDTLEEILDELFEDVEAAHRQEYGDERDREWPLWFADYLCDPLRDALDADFSRSELVYLLVLASKEHSCEAPGSNWKRYFIQFFCDRYE